MKMFILPACVLQVWKKIENSLKHSNNHDLYDLYAYRHLSGQVAKNPNLWKNEKNTNYESLCFALFRFFRNLLCVLGVHLCFQTSNYLEVKNGIILVKRYFPEKVFFKKSPFTDNTY